MKWFKELADENKQKGTVKYSIKELYDLFKMWMSENEIEIKYSAKKFGMFMTKMISKTTGAINKTKIHGYYHYEINFTDLK